MCSSDYMCAGNRLVTKNMSVKPSMQHRGLTTGGGLALGFVPVSIWRVDQAFLLECVKSQMFNQPLCSLRDFLIGVNFLV